MLAAGTMDEATSIRDLCLSPYQSARTRSRSMRPIFLIPSWEG